MFLSHALNGRMQIYVGGHLTTWYKAAEAPGADTNPQVQASLVDGLEVSLLDPETPTDVCFYYVEQGNDKVNAIINA